MRPSQIVIILTLAVAVFFMAFYGCFPRNHDPTVEYHDTAAEAYAAARDDAARLGGLTFVVLGTRSMEPLLWGGDYIVVDPGVSVDKVELGRVITYHAEWQQPGQPPVTHRITARDAYGLIVAGDNVKGLDHPENRYRVTAANYVGAVTKIHRTRL